MASTPKAGWTQTSEQIEWAEEMSSFLLREKNQAQRCLHDCERLLNGSKVKSDSLKDGLRELMAKTEDKYGTLLHLEEVLNMKNLGDSAVVVTNNVSSTFSSSSVAIKNSSTKQSGRFRQSRVRSFELEQKEDEEADDLVSEDILFDDGHRDDQGDHEIENFDEDSGLPEANYKSRPGPEKPSMIAKSLPMNVPMQRRMVMDNSPPDIDEETRDIPTKIAELARSLHVDAIGDLPSPRLLD